MPEADAEFSWPEAGLNRRGSWQISLQKTPVSILIVKSREALQIVRECHELY